jgi:hypothetical protein
LILHWDGTRRKHVASPSPSASSNILMSVPATSARNAWVVVGSASGAVLFVYWNGASWKQVS